MQRTAADQILRELQNNPDMWLQVVHILQNTKSLNTKFFALQVSSSFNCVLPVLLPFVYFSYQSLWGLTEGLNIVN